MDRGLGEYKFKRFAVDLIFTHVALFCCLVSVFLALKIIFGPVVNNKTDKVTRVSAHLKLVT